jgi:hypothetical protein
VAEGLLPEDLDVSVAHCGIPMRPKGGGVHWVGIEEHTTARFACDVCGLRVVVSAVDLDPLPTGDV